MDSPAHPPAPPQAESPTISVIVPVYNGGENFRQCLAALCAAQPGPLELLVVDDGSQDGSGDAARARGAQVLQTSRPASGPALARNLGARHARGAILFFVDADVAVPPDVFARLTSAFADPALDALFGSYDDAPAAPSFPAQYKNLMHHYTHQSARVESNSFWAGCGAIRAAVFAAVGGFKTTFTRPSVEDIELGYRLARAGHKVQLRRELQVKHLKAWTYASMLKSDIFDRALPWSRLLKTERAIPPDLNLRPAHRLSAALCWLLLLAVPAALWQSWLWLAVALILILLLVLNADLYLFFLRKRGVLFVLRAIPLHWLYYLYSSAALLYVWVFERPQGSSGQQV